MRECTRQRANDHSSVGQRVPNALHKPPSRKNRKTWLVQRGVRALRNEFLGPVKGIDRRHQANYKSERVRKSSSLPPDYTRAEKPVCIKDSVKTLSELAEENGIEIDSAYQAGNCGTCMVSLRSGTVKYHYEPGFKPEIGTCLASAAIPNGDVKLEV